MVMAGAGPDLTPLVRCLPSLSVTTFVRFGSLEDILTSPRHVRFAPQKRTVVSALSMYALCQ